MRAMLADMFCSAASDTGTKPLSRKWRATKRPRNGSSTQLARPRWFHEVAIRAERAMKRGAYCCQDARVGDMPKCTALVHMAVTKSENGLVLTIGCTQGQHGVILPWTEDDPQFVDNETTGDV